MADLKSTLSKKIPFWRAEVRELVAGSAETVVSSITVKQLFKGLRGVEAVVCDTSYVDPREGLFIRGIPVLELIDRTAEEIFFLLCTGELPDENALEQLRDDLAKRAEVPEYVWKVIESMPENTNPMVLMSMAMMAMQRESIFLSRYNEGMLREDHWKATLEDALNIIARLPVISAGIYRKHILKKTPCPPKAGDGFMDNFARMLCIEDPDGSFREFIHRFVVVHSDHEGANASVLTSRIVNSSLSDLYYSISAAMNSLSGPLHGLANQESVKFVLKIREKFNGLPANDELKNYIWNYLQSGRVIPGFGHAVLRNKDPRYIALFEFGKKVCPDDPVFQIVEKLGEMVPPLLIKQGKAKNPYPNIDGVSGALLYHFGIKELNYYTAMFSTSQILGICAQLIINRAIYSPIIRPKSVTTRWLQSYVSDVI
jgi:citrate synthase